MAATTAYRIVCVTKSTHRSPSGAIHGHLLDVGIGDDRGWTERLSVASVRSYLRLGYSFFTVSPSTGATALVKPYDCCGIATLRSENDAVTDNNLDNLSTCTGG
jgi:hypothetical protein